MQASFVRFCCGSFKATADEKTLHVSRRRMVCAFFYAKVEVPLGEQGLGSKVS
jgi:hypothetical protein